MGRQKRFLRKYSFTGFDFTVKVNKESGFQLSTPICGYSDRLLPLLLRLCFKHSDSLHDSGCWCKDSACCNHVSVRHNQYVDQLFTLVVWSSKYYDGSRGSCPDWDQPGFPVWPPQSLSSFVWIHIILAGLMMTLFFWVCKETESVTVARGLAERTSWFEDMFMGRLESTPARVYWGRQCDQERRAHNGRLFVSVCVSTLHLHLS